MSVQITVTINGATRIIAAHHDAAATWLLTRFTPNTLQYFTSEIQPSPVWLLIDDNYIAVAEETAIMLLHNTRMITPQYAYDSLAYQYIVQILHSYGMYINIMNIGLLMFTQYLWYKHKENSPLQKTRALIQQYPHLFMQPESFIRAHQHIMKEQRVIPTAKKEDIPTLKNKQDGI